MKTIISIFLLVSAVTFQVEVFANHEGHPHEASVDGKVESSKPDGEGVGEIVTIKAKGLVCDYCARALEKVFMKRPEVQGLAVDLTTKIITIRLKDGQTLDDKTLRDLVTKAGYNIESVERNG